MTLVSFTIPDAPEQLPAWLEEKLVSSDLAALVGELAAVHGSTTSNPTSPGEPLDRVLGSQREEILALGLARLPSAVISQLLRRPRLLLDLQAEVLTHGGDYWRQLIARNQSLSASVTRGTRRIQRFIASESAAAPTSSPALRRPLWQAPAWGWLAAAAALAGLIVTLSQPHQPPKPADPTSQYVEHKPDEPKSIPSPNPNPAPNATEVAVGWGWAKPEALPKDVSRDVYLKALADAGDQWFKKKPDSGPAMARRLNEFRQGCSILLLAAHEPLPAADRTWLLDHCRVWAARADAQLAALENGTKLEDVGHDVDELMHKIVGDLKTRAASASS